ncbi:UNVERIFIED_ORG: hypothetical protein M2193_002356 [Bradyrhizobium japonicum]
MKGLPCQARKPFFVANDFRLRLEVKIRRYIFVRTPSLSKL